MKLKGKLSLNKYLSLGVFKVKRFTPSQTLIPVLISTFEAFVSFARSLADAQDILLWHLSDLTE